MRVLLVANTLPPRDVSGAGEQVRQLAWALRQLGHEVEVLGRGRNGAWGPKVLFPLTVVPAGLLAVRRFRPDVVQVHESDGGLLLGLLGLLRTLRARRRGRTGCTGCTGCTVQRGRPLLVALLQVSYGEERRAVRPLRDRSRPGDPVVGRPTAAERRFRTLRAPIHIALGRLSARHADLVLAPSRATAHELVRDYGIADERVATLPNVTGAPLFEEETAGGEHGATAPEPYLLYVGRLRVRKGVELLLEALARLRATKSETQSVRVPSAAVPRLLLAGDGERRAALEAHSRALGLEHAVSFLGRRSASQVRALLARALVLVVPSTYEGMPLVILEAMELAVPVVASAVSGIPEVVVDGETGWLVEPEDSAALAAALRHALDQPAERRRRGGAGRRRLEERYRPLAAARVWLEIVSAAVATLPVGEQENVEG